MDKISKKKYTLGYYKKPSVKLVLATGVKIIVTSAVFTALLTAITFCGKIIWGGGL